MRRAPAISSGAKRCPGARPSRSIGPEIEIAATTSPAGERTGADTEATPASRCATDCAQPRRRTSASPRSVNSASATRRRVRPGRATRTAPAPRSRPSAEAVRRAAPSCASPEWLSAAATHTRIVAVAAVELRALATLVAHPRQHGRRRGDERIGQRDGEFADPRPEHETPFAVASRAAGVPPAPRPGGAPSRGADPVERDEFGKRGRRCRDRGEDRDRFVDDADAAMLSHYTIL